MMNNFRVFVENQPRDRVINHSSWISCAIGDYYREERGMDDDAILDSVCGDFTVLTSNHGTVMVAKAVHDIVGDEVVTLLLNNPKIDGILIIPTYGDLQDVYNTKHDLESLRQSLYQENGE